MRPTIPFVFIIGLLVPTITRAADQQRSAKPNVVVILADDKNAEVGRHTAVLRIITGFMAEAT